MIIGRCEMLELRIPLASTEQMTFDIISQLLPYTLFPPLVDG
jgi:hypothetical protein